LPEPRFARFASSASLQAGQLEQLLRQAEQRGDGAAAALAAEAQAARAAAAQVPAGLPFLRRLFAVLMGWRFGCCGQGMRQHAVGPLVMLEVRPC
jgi:hypothetical protein